LNGHSRLLLFAQGLGPGGGASRFDDLAAVDNLDLVRSVVALRCSSRQWHPGADHVG